MSAIEPPAIWRNSGCAEIFAIASRAGDGIDRGRHRLNRRAAAVPVALAPVLPQNVIALIKGIVDQNSGRLHGFNREFLRQMPKTVALALLIYLL